MNVKYVVALEPLALFPVLAFILSLLFIFLRSKAAVFCIHSMQVRRRNKPLIVNSMTFTKSLGIFSFVKYECVHWSVKLMESKRTTLDITSFLIGDLLKVSIDAYISKVHIVRVL